MIDDITNDFDTTMRRIGTHYEYDKKVELGKATEQLQYKRVMEKVLRRTSRNM